MLSLRRRGQQRADWHRAQLPALRADGARGSQPLLDVAFVLAAEPHLGERHHAGVLWQGQLPLAHPGRLQHPAPGAGAAPAGLAGPELLQPVRACASGCPSAAQSRTRGCMQGTCWTGWAAIRSICCTGCVHVPAGEPAQCRAAWGLHARHLLDWLGLNRCSRCVHAPVGHLIAVRVHQRSAEQHTGVHAGLNCSI